MVSSIEFYNSNKPQSFEKTFISTHNLKGPSIKKIKIKRISLSKIEDVFANLFE